MLGRHLGNPIFRSYVSFSFRALCWTSWEVSQISKNRHQPKSIFPLSSFCLMLFHRYLKFQYQIHPILEKPKGPQFTASNRCFCFNLGRSELGQFHMNSLRFRPVDLSGFDHVEKSSRGRKISEKRSSKRKTKNQKLSIFTCSFFRRSPIFLRIQEKKVLPKCCLQLLGAAFQRILFFQIKALHMWQSTANGTRC